MSDNLPALKPDYFEILMDCTIIACQQNQNNLQINCQFFDEKFDGKNDRDVDFTLFINNFSKIIDNDILTDTFSVQLIEGDVWSYKLNDHSLVLMMAWVAYQPRENQVHVYEFFSDDIFIKID